MVKVEEQDLENKIKLIVSDMDGTLLNEKKELPKDIFEVIDKCIQEGIIFAIATGRQHQNIKNYFKGYCDKMLIIAENGTIATYQDTPFYLSKIDAHRVPEFIQNARTIKNSWAVYCTSDKAYIENNHPQLVEECKKYYSSLEVVEDLLKIEEDCLKIAICDLDGAETNSYQLFKEYEEEFQVTVSAAIWLDITNHSENKGNTLAQFQKQFDIAKEETMVFGDYLNDVSLMPLAQKSYAMENAHPDLKKLANFIAPSNEENGVTIIVKEYLKKVGG